MLGLCPLVIEVVVLDSRKCQRGKDMLHLEIPFYLFIYLFVFLKCKV